MRHTVYMENGSIINGINGNIIENPAVLFDKETGCCHGWGEKENVEAKYAKYIYGYVKAGMHDMASDMIMLELSPFKTSREMQCFILRYASEHSGTGFLADLFEKMQTPDALSWLQEKMQKMGLDLSEKEFK